jgi:hypothetical protein
MYLNVNSNNANVLLYRPAYAPAGSPLNSRGVHVRLCPRDVSFHAAGARFSNGALMIIAKVICSVSTSMTAVVITHEIHVVK